jgi:hypothetical protein
MTRTSTIVTLAILSSVLTPVVVKATGTTEAPATVQQASVQVAAATTAAEPACARKVKVIYAGYGEGQGASCAPADIRR